ncbi:hypothetical protein J6590_008457 [Homalodisca vitripennis]|nr:hypothetical protein J6590_008457 [Homalodisca vitripennis]
MDTGGNVIRRNVSKNGSVLHGVAQVALSVIQYKIHFQAPGNINAMRDTGVDIIRRNVSKYGSYCIAWCSVTVTVAVLYISQVALSVIQYKIHFQAPGNITAMRDTGVDIIRRNVSKYGSYCIAWCSVTVTVAVLYISQVALSVIQYKTHFQAPGKINAMRDTGVDIIRRNVSKYGSYCIAWCSVTVTVAVLYISQVALSVIQYKTHFQAPGKINAMRDTGVDIIRRNVAKYGSYCIAWRSVTVTVAVLYISQVALSVIQYKTHFQAPGKINAMRDTGVDIIRRNVSKYGSYCIAWCSVTVTVAVLYISQVALSVIQYKTHFQAPCKINAMRDTRVDIIRRNVAKNGAYCIAWRSVTVTVAVLYISQGALLVIHVQRTVPQNTVSYVLLKFILSNSITTKH